MGGICLTLVRRPLMCTRSHPCTQVYAYFTCSHPWPLKYKTGLIVCKTSLYPQPSKVCKLILAPTWLLATFLTGNWNSLKQINMISVFRLSHFQGLRRKIIPAFNKCWKYFVEDGACKCGLFGFKLFSEDGTCNEVNLWKSLNLDT